MESKYHFQSLNGIRGIGAAVIVFFHVWALCGFSGVSAKLDMVVSQFDSPVRLFFILSSFSILCGYEKNILEENRVIQFYQRRIAKIAPAFYFALCCHVFLNWYIYHSIPTSNELLANISFVFGLIPKYAESLVWAGWAIGVEWIFYLSIPLFVVIIREKKRLIIAFIFSICLMWNFDATAGAEVINGYTNFVRYIPYFFMGAILYSLIPRILSLRDEKKKSIIFWCGILISIPIAIIIAKYVNRDMGMLLGFSAIIVGGIYGYGKIIDNAVLNFVGGLSHDIYLFHMIVVRIMLALGTVELIKSHISNFYLAYLLVAGIALVFTIILSYLFHRCIKYCAKCKCKGRS